MGLTVESGDGGGRATRTRFTPLLVLGVRPGESSASPASLLADAARAARESTDHALISLRWIAIAGMLVTSVVGHVILPRLALGPLLWLLGAVAVVNLGWSAWLARATPARARGHSVAPQIFVDVALLGAILWFSGGFTNPFASFLTLHTVLAGLLGTRRTVLISLAATLLVGAALSWAPPLPLDGARLAAHSLSLLGGVVSVVALSAFTGFFVLLLVQKLEALRERTARGEKLAGLGRAVMAMCHQLNTPLGTIVIAAKDLSHVGRELGSTETEQLASTIIDQARRASSTIGLLGGYLGASEQREPIDLTSFVPGLATRVLSRLGYGGRLSLNEDRPVSDGSKNPITVPITVQVPRTALEHVLTNVLENAVEATHDAPAPAIEVVVGGGGETAEVAIRDNGRGVSSALAERLGEPFLTTKGEQGRNGLGLYVSSLLAEKMAGRLQFDSTEGKGTEVTLVLPRKLP